MRILAVTDGANVSVALGLISRKDLDVTTVGSFEGLAEADPEAFDAVLVAYRDTERAVDAAGAVKRLSGLPCVVVAPRIEGRLPDGVVGLSPPTHVSAVAQALHGLVVGPEPEPSQSEHVEDRPEARPVAEPIAPTPVPDIVTPAPSTQASDPAPVEWDEPADPTEPIEAAGASADVEAPVPSEPAEDPASVEPTPSEPKTVSQPVAADGDERPSLRSRVTRLLRHGTDGAASERRRRAFPARERIDEGLRAAEELQTLIDDLPEINERRALAARLVDEVNATIAGAEAVVLWSPDGVAGLEALAYHGVPFGVVQRGASTDVPVLDDLLGEHDTVAYRAEERFSDYLEGLPGLRGSCVLGAALRAHDEVHALLVISGDDLDASDLEAVRSEIDLYTVALAVAAHIELLRTRRTIDLTVEDGEWVTRGD